jgi:neutral ceramidase
MNKPISLLLVIVLIVFSQYSYSQSPNGGDGTMEVGIARVDITPVEPIRLSGYGARSHTETTVIIQRLEAKAMAFGSDGQHPSVLITVDLIGITEQITSKLVQLLSNKVGIDPANVVICASHTHGGPEIGNLINILQYREDKFTDSLLELNHLVHIARYTEMLSQKLEEVALAALRNRKPAFVAWGQGQASFAANRRTKGGPVDPALPLLRITNPDGTLRAVLVNYACHGTTLEGVNEINGDWIGEAQRIIEAKHPGAIAMVAIGCGADANPQPRGELQYITLHGQEIADNVDKLLASQLQELTVPPIGKIKMVKLPFSKIPTVAELIKATEEKTLRGYYAWLALERLQRGEKIPAEVNYPVQVWNFGDKLAMINLAGEVVVDYSIRLKNELGADHLWVNAYTNDVPSYIASRRVIREGGYEADFSMFCYDKPSPFVEEVEDIIIKAVHDIIPTSFKIERDTLNHQVLIESNKDGVFHLTAALAQAVGPAIKYMPEWGAFGWFTTEDQVEWTVNLEKTGKYEVFLKWSVSDDEAGKSFVLESGNKKVKGRVGKTGSWFTYSKRKVGVINLSAGQQKMVFKSNAKSEKGAMLDLAEVTLIYVK